jgi:hypothetical protein
MAANIPDLTAPVTRGQVASIGVVGNIGTAKGGSTNIAGAAGAAGATAGTVGGSVTNGISSFNQAPVNPSTFTKDVNQGGGTIANNTSSSNPASGQEQVGVAKDGETVASTSSGSLNALGISEETKFPDANVIVERPANGLFATSANSTVAGNRVNIAGISNKRTLGSVSDITNITNENNMAKNQASKSIGGAKAIGDPTVQDRDLLPGGFTDSNKISSNPASE